MKKAETDAPSVRPRGLADHAPTRQAEHEHLEASSMKWEIIKKALSEMPNSGCPIDGHQGKRPVSRALYYADQAAVVTAARGDWGPLWRSLCESKKDGITLIDWREGPRKATTPAAAPAAAAAPAPVPAAAATVEVPAADPATIKIAQKWRDFMSEFRISVSPRTLNTVAYCATTHSAAQYIRARYELEGHSAAADLGEKTRSPEFQELVERTIALTPKKHINTRLEVYYGPPGGGKTTAATRRYPGAEVLACRPDMTPDELFRGFTFIDGKPAFVGSPLERAMKNGTPVILDEINLLQEDCLRVMQAVTDMKTSVVIGTETVTIKEGFRVVGTMNLAIGERIYPLPEALVDRAAVIERFDATAEMLAAAAF